MHIINNLKYFVWFLFLITFPNCFVLLLGYASNVKFCAMLVRNLEVSIEEIERVIAWLDPSNLGKLSANYFLSALREIQPHQSSKAAGDDEDEEEDE